MECISKGVWLKNGLPVFSGEDLPSPRDGREKTMAYKILRAHHQGGSDRLHLKFDALISHDITYVGIIQTARGSGMKEFPVPYALTNCHNSLCAVGGTINEDDHRFGLSAAIKYGGIYVPANQSVIHTYAREALSGGGKMILGSDSHTRYGALGTMGIGEGGPELAKQLLSNTYDVEEPKVILVWLENAPKPGVGPHDVAISLVGATFPNGFVKNCVMEFAGPGIQNLSVDFRCGIDVMTTETTCLSSIWETDDKVKEYYTIHGRPDAYKEMKVEDGAYYDGMIRVDLARQECMIALPFHPSNAYTIKEVNEHGADLLRQVELEAEASFGKGKGLDLVSKYHDGKVWADQGIIAGCAGGVFDNLCDAAAILKGNSVGNSYFNLSVYPGSVPVSMEITRNGVAADLMMAGAIIKPAFCGPCFGAGDVPGNGCLSIRHATRNFPNREGSAPAAGQIAAAALMDARSIAATAVNGGALTPATEMEHTVGGQAYHYDGTCYEKRVYNGFGNPKPEEELVMGPNITDWPKMNPLTKDLLVRFTAVIHDPVTTTDELIPSGETSSYRSNPVKLATFALSRRVPEYVGRCHDVAAAEADRLNGHTDADWQAICDALGANPQETAFGSCVFAEKPGDGSAREQAASCQRVLGGMANLCYEFATKRYRSNCINWGIMPFTLEKGQEGNLSDSDYLYVPNIREKVEKGDEEFPAILLIGGEKKEVTLSTGILSPEDREILLQGCLMNFYAAKAKK